MNNLTTDMRIDSQHWLAGVRRVPSPYWNERPAGCEVNLIVLHGISLPPGKFGTGRIDQLFAGELPCEVARQLDLTGVRVSSHVLLDREGGCTQYVAFDKRAWHAGQSSWQGRSNCNDYAIGIELEGTDSQPYRDTQYDALARLVSALLDTYPGLSPDAVVGHNEVAPGRKTDPGAGFDWKRLLSVLYYSTAIIPTGPHRSTVAES